MSNDPRNIDELYSAFEAADNMLLKKYIPTLSKAHCIQIPEEIQKMTPGDNVSLYRIASIVYDKEENVQEKLTSVYSTALSLKDASLVMLLHGTKERVDLFMGMADKELKSDDINGVRALRFDDMGNAFESAMFGIFPGT